MELESSKPSQGRITAVLAGCLRFLEVLNRLISPISILGLVSREERFVALLKLKELFDEEAESADICA